VNFREDLAKLIVEGRKTETRRMLSDNPRSPWYRLKCGFVVGKDYAVCPGRNKSQIERIKITRTFQQRLGQVDLGAAIAEGVKTVRAYEELFQEINGFWDPELRVWVVRFELVPS
jgi:uncharacterized protein YhfF